MVRLPVPTTPKSSVVISKVVKLPFGVFSVNAPACFLLIVKFTAPVALPVTPVTVTVSADDATYAVVAVPVSVTVVASPVVTVVVWVTPVGKPDTVNAVPFATLVVVRVNVVVPAVKAVSVGEPEIAAVAVTAAAAVVQTTGPATAAV